MKLRPIFRRRGEPQAERWEVGDLAECIIKGPWLRNGIKPSTEGPAFGERYVVKFVGTGRLRRVMLGFSRFGSRTYSAGGFRKVRPQADEAIAADAAWVGALLWQPAPVGGSAS